MDQAANRAGTAPHRPGHGSQHQHRPERTMDRHRQGHTQQSTDDNTISAPARWHLPGNEYALTLLPWPKGTMERAAWNSIR